MPLSYWIDISALVGVGLLAFALALNVIGLDPQRSANRYFSIFALAMSIWAAASILLSRALRMGAAFPTVWITAVGSALYITGPALLLFADRFLELGNRRIRQIGAIGLLLTIPVAWLFAIGGLISTVSLNQYGIRIFTLQPLGRIILLLPVSILCFVLFLFFRRGGYQRQPYLILGITGMILGLFAGAQHFPLPFSSLLNFFAVISFGWAVLRRQIFNPLHIKTLELQRETAARQAATQALGSSEERYRTLFEAAGDAILLMDGQKFVDCNRQALALFACDRQTIINATPETFSPPFQPDGRTSGEAALAKISAALTGTTQHFEWNHQRADGVLFDAEVTLNRVYIGSRVFIQALVRDVSVRNAAAAAQAQRHALESLIAAISTRFVNLSAAEFQPALQAALAQILEYTGASHGIICLLNATRTHLECLASASLSPDGGLLDAVSKLPLDQLPWLQSYWQTAQHTIQSLDHNLLPDSPAHWDQFYEFITSAGIRSILILPVHKFDRLAGMLALMDYQRTPAWGQAAESVVQLLGELVSTLIERQAMQIALEASEERLELALEGARLGLWDWEISTGVVTYNHTWAEMLGYRLDEITPDLSGWELLVHPADLPEVLQTLQAHLEGKTSFYETEHRMRTKQGAWKWILDRGRVVARDKQGAPLRAAGTHLDLSARKQAEHERDRLASIIDATADIVIITGPDLTIYYVNQAARGVLGLAPDVDLRDYQLTDFLPSWAAQQLQQEGMPAASQHGFWTGESAIRHQGKGRQDIPVSQLLMLHRDKTTASELFVTVMRDIRERIESERRIQRHVHRLRALHQVGSTINASLNLQVILGVLLEQALNLLDVSAAAVMLYNPELHLLAYAASRGLQPAPDRRRTQRASEGFAGRAVMERRRVIIPSLSAQTRSIRYINERSLRAVRILLGYAIDCKRQYPRCS